MSRTDAALRWSIALLTALFTSVAAAQEADAAPPAGAAPQPAAAESPPPAAAEAPETLDAKLARMEARVAELTQKQEEAEAAALLTESASTDETTSHSEPAIRMYGFTDFGYDKWFYHKGTGGDAVSLARPTEAGTFVFGNLNLYFDATPLEKVRVLIETRLTLAPHGEETQLGPPLGMSYMRNDTTAFDFSSPSSQTQLRLGGLYLERAYTEYAFSPLFKLQWGLFLTPFGIWNLDHGSPTLISLMLPTMIASQMFPTRLIGFHAYGSQFFGAWELAYALHISNGRSPLDFALSEDKGVGARVYLANESDYGRLVLGVSGYAGKYLDQEKRLLIGNPNDRVDFTEKINYDEQVLGVDLAFDTGGLRVRSEFTWRWVKYKDGLNETGFGRDGQLVYMPNRMEWNGYILAAYRTPWRIEPYVEGEMASKGFPLPRFAQPANLSTPNIAALILSLGLNVELTTHTLFKAQFAYSASYDRKYKTKSTSTPVIFLRLVQSF